MAGALDKEKVRAGLRRTAQPHRSTELKDFRVPTLLIAGGEDVVFPAFLASAIAAALPCGEAHLIPDAGHSPYFEQAATFNRAGRGVSGAPPLRRRRCPRTTRGSPFWDSPSSATASRRSAPRQDFETDVDIRGNRIVTEARSGASITLPDLPGFFTEMDRTGHWTPVPLRVSQAQPGGPVEESFFKDFLAEIEAGLRAALPVDGSSSPATARRWPRAPTIPTATCSRSSAASSGRTCRWSSIFDLHANVSRRMTDNLSVFVGYLENPHTDIHERGVEAAKHMRECLAGARTAVTMVKVPLVPPQISLLTARAPTPT